MSRRKHRCRPWSDGFLRALVIALVLSSATVSVTRAQGADAPNAQVATHIRFDHLGIDDGLSSARVNAVVQDQRGYMWIGTSDGLDRYDGHDVRAYRSDPLMPGTLDSSYVLTLYVDHGGAMWVGTAAGLDLYNPATDTFRRVPRSLTGTVLSSVYQDPSGLTWVGTRSNGVYTFDPQLQEVTNYRHQAEDSRSLSSDAVLKIVGDQSGSVWIGTMAGLNRFDSANSGFKVYRHDDQNPASLSNDAIFDILEDQYGTLWVGTDGGGLDALDATRDAFTHYRNEPNNPNSVANNRIGCLAQATDGSLVIGTFSSGLSVLDPSRQNFVQVRHEMSDPASLINDVVFNCYTDSSGLVWVATVGGLDYFDPARQVVTLYRPATTGASTLSSENVTAVYDDSRGRLWVGTQDHGLDMIDRQTGQVTHYPADGNGSELSHPFVYALAADPAGSLWVGTYGGGLDRLDPATRTVTAYRHDANNANSLTDDTVNDLLIARDGTVWVSTRAGGLNHLDPASGRWTAYRHDPADSGTLSADAVRALAEDAAGNIWVGTNGGGLDRVVPTTGLITHFRHNAAEVGSLADDNVFALLVDRAGVVWVGLQGAGLDAYQPNDGSGSFRHYREQDGLASDEVVSIVEDGQPGDPSPGDLWIATGRGLSRLGADRRTFRTFGPIDGLPAAPFTRAHGNSQAGKLLFGTFQGLVEFDYRRLQDDDSVPPIVFTDFLLDNQRVPITLDGPLTRPIDLSDTVRLNWDQRVISIEFAALSYRLPSPTRYRYMLEGFDDRWTEVDSSHRLVTYTNLDPGTYTFRVTASNTSGVWSPVDRTLTLVIIPPWWATWWGRALVILLLAGAVAAVALWRVRALHARERQLQALVTQRTTALETALGTRDVFLRTLAHDLKAPLTSVGWHVQVLTRNAQNGSLESGALRSGLDAIAESAAEAMSAIDELHDLTRLVAGAEVPLQYEPIELSTFVQHLVDDRRFATRANFSFESSAPGLHVEADRSRLARVLQNLLENAIKYSPSPGEIRVSVGRVKLEATDWASVSVQDSGIGIPAADLPHVFERYHRGANVADVPGEGLGLASAQQLIRLHRGELLVDSVEGIGTTVTIRLPLLRQDTVTHGSNAVRDPQG